MIHWDYISHNTLSLFLISPSLISPSSLPLSPFPLSLLSPVPCTPTNVTATRTCGQSSVAVTWLASMVASQYTAVAVGNGGHRSECSTNGTSCSLDALQCGQVYQVGVMATGSNCSSQTASLSTGKPARLSWKRRRGDNEDPLPKKRRVRSRPKINTCICPPPAVPCPPANLSSQLYCSNGSTLLSWSPSPNAVSYSGAALGPDGAPLSCSSSSPSCLISGLVCGRSYNLSVTAFDGSCASLPSAPLRQDSGTAAVSESSAEVYSLPRLSLYSVYTNILRKYTVLCKRLGLCKYMKW